MYLCCKCSGRAVPAMGRVTSSISSDGNRKGRRPESRSQNGRRTIAGTSISIGGCVGGSGLGLRGLWFRLLERGVGWMVVGSGAVGATGDVSSTAIISLNTVLVYQRSAIRHKLFNFFLGIIHAPMHCQHLWLHSKVHTILGSKDDGVVRLRVRTGKTTRGRLATAILSLLFARRRGLLCCGG